MGRLITVKLQDLPITTTKEEWKRINRYCRTIARSIEFNIGPRIATAYAELMLFGTAVIRMPKEL